MDLNNLLPLLGIGSIIAAIIGIIGAIIGGYMQSKFQHQKQIKEYEHELKKKRYLAINILLLTKVDFDHKIAGLIKNRPDIQTEKGLDREIEMEFLNAFIFADNSVIQALDKFIISPSNISYYEVVQKMREDLWGKRKHVALPKNFDHIRGEFKREKKY